MPMSYGKAGRTKMKVMGNILQYCNEKVAISFHGEEQQKRKRGLYGRLRLLGKAMIISLL
jgi:hypothetical protein